MRRGGCNDSECQNRVCALNPTCCSEFWSYACVAEARYQNCSLPQGQQSCFDSNLFASGCQDSTCKAIVCDQLPHCCSDVYGFDCVDIALESCEIPAPSNSCFESSLTPNCTNQVCAELVCRSQPSCCTGSLQIFLCMLVSTKKFGWNHLLERSNQVEAAAI